MGADRDVSVATAGFVAACGQLWAAFASVGIRNLR
jgi:hypothetical protein